MRVINRHIYSLLIDGCNICEYEHIIESNQKTNIVYMLWMDVTDVKINQ